VPKLVVERFSDLGKPGFVLAVWFLSSSPFFNTSSASSKNDARFKSGQNRLSVVKKIIVSLILLYWAKQYFLIQPSLIF